RRGPCLAGRRRCEQLLDQLREAVGLDLDLRQEVAPGGFVPLHITSPQGAHETLDVAEWQAQLVGGGGQQLVTLRQVRQAIRRRGIGWLELDTLDIPREAGYDVGRGVG